PPYSPDLAPSDCWLNQNESQRYNPFDSIEDINTNAMDSGVTQNIRTPLQSQVLSAKLNPSTSSHRQSSGASFWGGNWVPKLLGANCIHLYDAAVKADTSSRECSSSAVVKHQSTAH
ncbi:hypothetical protein TNCV_1302521, partial [Trichonephila clavipes]